MKNQIFNPYLPSFEYIPDGEPRVWNNRLYIYGSHDKFGANTYCENDYVCWSAPLNDLSDWNYEGTIYTVNDHPFDEIHERTCLYAPDVVLGTDGKYYLYYSMSGSSIISVAVCDTPAGHFHYIGDVCYSDNGSVKNLIPAGFTKGEYHQFDPSVLVDDDGRVYLYSGFAPKADCDDKGRLHIGCHAYELESDMITIKQGPFLVIPKNLKQNEGAAYFEAPSMRKINSLYYLVYSARATGLFYYYSDNPLNDFKFGGRIHSTSDVGINGHDTDFPIYPIGNIHGGIARLNGQYYIFSHRHTNASSYQRQGVAEPISFDENGMIAQVEATSCGLNNKPLIGKGIYPAYIACVLFYPANTKSQQKTARITQDLKDIYSQYQTQALSENEISVIYKNLESTQNPVQYLCDINDSLTFGYKYFTFDHEIKSIICKVRGNADGILSVTLRERSDTVGNINLKLNSDNWTEIIIPCHIALGTHALYFNYTGLGSFDMLTFELSHT